MPCMPGSVNHMMAISRPPLHPPPQLRRGYSTLAAGIRAWLAGASASEEHLREELSDGTDEKAAPDSSGREYEYRGHSVPAILDMFLQQEALQLLATPHTPTPHTHALDCYPPEWHDMLQDDSPHTCFFASALDPWNSAPSIHPSATAAVVSGHWPAAGCLVLR
mmetsp:Transcript_8084/g.13718  ORF Transcript_8084/g.13718 Transcript_8084/m.13718 type:complete len:164 (-) Transcript_8084:154-645(-)